MRRPLTQGSAKKARVSLCSNRDTCSDTIATFNIRAPSPGKSPSPRSPRAFNYEVTIKRQERLISKLQTQLFVMKMNMDTTIEKMKKKYARMERERDEYQKLSGKMCNVRKTAEEQKKS